MNIFSSTLRKLTRTAGYTLTRCQKENGYPLDFSQEEIALIEEVKPFTMTTPERIIGLIHALRYLHHNGIKGDIVECGVWRGGSMIVAAKTLINLGDTSRTLWLYDTFEGMTAPTEHDISNKGTTAAEKFEKRKLGDDSSDWCLASIEEVQGNVSTAGYPSDKIQYVKGKVEDTLPAQAPPHIALLRLDTDWYESTLHELESLFPRLVPGGILIIDDYGDWSGARKAVDEYIAKYSFPLFLSRMDDSARLAVKYV
jgi:O-methyltransferase